MDGFTTSEKRCMMNPSFIISEMFVTGWRIGENVRIVFWGSERRSSVTSNVLILTGYLACQKGYRIAILELAEETYGIQSFFSKINEPYRRPYIHTLVRRQLYYVSIEQWREEKRETLPELIKWLEYNMDMVCINIANRIDSEARELMYSANLVVVNLRQKIEAFEHYFSGYGNLSSRILFLIGNYYEDGECDKVHLQKKYRIREDELAVIPNSPEYQMACSRKKIERYLRMRGNQPMSAITSQFIKMVAKTAEVVCEAVRKYSCSKILD